MTLGHHALPQMHSVVVCPAHHAEAHTEQWPRIRLLPWQSQPKLKVAPAQAGMPSVPQRLQTPSQHVMRVSSRQVPPLGSLSGMSQHSHFRSPQRSAAGLSVALAALGAGFTAGLGAGLGALGGGAGGWELSKVQKLFLSTISLPVHGLSPAGVAGVGVRMLAALTSACLPQLHVLCTLLPRKNGSFEGHIACA